jgi:hypothetical protein
MLCKPVCLHPQTIYNVLLFRMLAKAQLKTIAALKQPWPLRTYRQTSDCSQPRRRAQRNGADFLPGNPPEREK